MTNMVLIDVKMGYSNLFTKTGYKPKTEEDKYYSLNIVLDKDENKKEIESINKLTDSVLENHNITHQDLRHKVLIDNDTKKYMEGDNKGKLVKDTYSELNNSFSLNLKNKQFIQKFDNKKIELKEDIGLFVPGCTVNVKFELVVYEVAGEIVVSKRALAVQFVENKGFDHSSSFNIIENDDSEEVPF